MRRHLINFKQRWHLVREKARKSVFNHVNIIIMYTLYELSLRSAHGIIILLYYLHGRSPRRR